MSDYKPRFSNKKPFQKRSFGRDSGPKQMFDAECNKCGNMAQVPFRPNGRKPVYCDNCFVKDEAPQRPSYDRGPRREFGPRPSYNSAPREDRGMQEVKQELAAVNQKLERLISLMTPKIVVTAAPAKAPAKKAAKKKVSKKKK